MLVSNKIIAAYGGSINEYEKGSYIFYEGSKPNYFFQVIKGSVKVIQYNDK
ncbi:MAG: cyclic nucleotide-binding domain-containing protein [Saprospiraceae bacterium]